MGNCLQRQYRPKSEKQVLRDKLLQEKEETGLITFYDTDTIHDVIPSVFDTVMDLEEQYKLGN
jgi:hypothetical protein